MKVPPTVLLLLMLTSVRSSEVNGKSTFYFSKGNPILKAREEASTTAGNADKQEPPEQPSSTDEPVVEKSRHEEL